MDEKEDNKNCQRSWESKGIEGSLSIDQCTNTIHNIG